MRVNLSLQVKVGFRNLLKRRTYTFLNVLGLSVSFCASYLIWYYVQDQSSFDSHFDHSENIYRVLYDIKYEKERVSLADVGQPVGPTLKQEYPEVIEAARIRRIGQTTTLTTDEKEITSNDVFVADQYFFNVFNVDLGLADKSNVLSEPNTVVLSEDLALRLFGHADVVGMFIGYSSVMSPIKVKITAVMKGLDKHTHLPYQALISYPTYFGEQELNNWQNRSYTYVLLDANSTIESLQSKVPEFAEKYLANEFAKVGGIPNLVFQPLTSIYLDKERSGEPYPHGDQSNLHILILVLILILSLGCINYINLATAVSVDREVEVQIKKTLGAPRIIIALQFMIDAIIITVLAGMVSVILLILVAPFYHDITGLNIDFSKYIGLEKILFILISSLLLGFLSGIYPSSLLAFSNKNISSLKRNPKQGGSFFLRQALVVLQYSISSFMIVGVVVVWSQTSYIKNRDVGFDAKEVIELEIPDEDSSLKNVPFFLQKVTKLKGVRGASLSEQDLNTYRSAGTQNFLGPDGEPIKTRMAYIGAGIDFFETLGIDLTKGRDFIESYNNSQCFLLNETAVNQYGWKGSELQLTWLNDYFTEDPVPYKAIGITKDFTIGESYRGSIPMIIYFDNRVRTSSKVFIGIESNNLDNTLNGIRQLSDEVFKSGSVEMTFVDKKLEMLYEGENTFMKLLSVFSIIILVITSIGIIGLVSFSIASKRREVAIRKIHGAGMFNVIKILSERVLVLSLLAIIIAVPFAHYSTELWLIEYPMRIDVNVWHFAIVLPISFLLTVLSIAYHSISAARSNPIEEIRND